MPTFDEVARRAAADLHEQVRPVVRTNLPALGRVAARERRRWLMPAAALLVIGGLPAMSIVLTHRDRRVTGPPSTPVASGPSTLVEDCYAQGQLRGQLSVTVSGNGQCGVTMAATISFDNETGQECSSDVMATIDPGGINMVFNSTSGFGGATGQWVPMGTPVVEAVGMNRYPVGIKVWDITLPALAPGEYTFMLPSLQCGTNPRSFPFAVAPGEPPPTTAPPSTTSPPVTNFPDTTTVVTATRLTMTGTPQELCDTAERTLDPNHSLWTTSVLSDQTMTSPNKGRWLFCQGDPAGGLGVIAMHDDLDGAWWATSVANGPLFHAGDHADVLAIDSEVARVVTSLPVGESTYTATTNDSGHTWTVVHSQLTTPPTSNPDPAFVLDEFLPPLPTGTAVYQGPVVGSQGPAAAYVPGVGVVGTIGGDIDRHFDLAIVDRGQSRPIGVRVQLTPTLAGGPDGRLYVADTDAATFSAYTVHNGAAARVAGPVTAGCELERITFDATGAHCGKATLALGTIDPRNAWVLHVDDGVLPPNTMLAPGRTAETGATHYQLANGDQLWLIPLTAGAVHRTAIVSLAGGQLRFAQIPAAAASVDLVRHLVYAWGPSDIHQLTRFDYSSLLPS